MIYVKVLWPLDRYTLLSAAKVNRNAHDVDVETPPDSGHGVVTFAMADFRAIWLMTASGETMGKIEGRAEAVPAVTVVINGETRIVHGVEIDRDQVVALAFPEAPTGDYFTVTYCGGRRGGSGELREGDAVSLKDEMAFNVARKEA